MERSEIEKHIDVVHHTRVGTAMVCIVQLHSGFCCAEAVNFPAEAKDEGEELDQQGSAYFAVVNKLRHHFMFQAAEIRLADTRANEALRTKLLGG